MPIPMPGTSAETVSVLLGDDHRQIDELFDEFCVDAAARDFSQAAHRFAELDARLRRHIEAEEAVLFPAFEQTTGITHGPTLVMRSEHTAIKGLLDQMKRLVTDAQDPSAAASRFRDLLGSHNAKEERVLYPLADQSLGRDLAVVLDRIRGLIAR